MVTMPNNRAMEATARVVNLDPVCFAHVHSGELVLAARVLDSVIVADEYGGSWLMPVLDFDQNYEKSNLCPMAR